MTAGVSERTNKFFKSVEYVISLTLYMIVLFAILYVGAYNEVLHLFEFSSGNVPYEFEPFAKSTMHVVLLIEINHTIFLFIRKENIVHILKSLLVLSATVSLREMLVGTEHPWFALINMVASIYVVLFICNLEQKWENKKQLS